MENASARRTAALLMNALRPALDRRGKLVFFRKHVNVANESQDRYNQRANHPDEEDAFQRQNRIMYQCGHTLKLGQLA